MASYAEIERLITGRRFQEPKFKQETTNAFPIVGQTHTEHWHSSFLCWLLDAHSSLRLGYYPLARLLTLYRIKDPDCGFTLRDIYSWDLDAVKFRTEKDTGQPAGIYDNSSSAGAAAINLRRKQRGNPARIKTVQGAACWKDEQGRTIQALMGQ